MKDPKNFILKIPSVKFNRINFLVLPYRKPFVCYICTSAAVDVKFELSWGLVVYGSINTSSPRELRRIVVHRHYQSRCSIRLSCLSFSLPLISHHKPTSITLPPPFGSKEPTWWKSHGQPQRTEPHCNHLFLVTLELFPGVRVRSPTTDRGSFFFIRIDQIITFGKALQTKVTPLRTHDPQKPHF